MLHYSTYTDEQLVGLLQSGDQRVFEEIYERYHKPVYAYLTGFLKDNSLAEDLTHEVFMKIWDMRAQVQVHTSFSSYLFRICHNKAINALEKIAVDNKLRNRVIQHLQAISSTQIQDTGALKEYDQLLENALESLPPQRRKVFRLCREEGKTYDETAALLGISRNTVKEHMVKAQKALRSFLDDKGDLAFLLVLILDLL
ncbi:RNA polymerase sigma factor [Pseudobacter ginsenosidimutans]|uniref:RNA polymerase sigma-70 factor (ECF subfamily) n=1 Tax=Pseudobacter ginsenosidimutans TaxID=661488 RepID=A0A4Q7MYG7_9BACT|nr:RNA polymerase sigma-70 factor [Pseudobacter ginsenosidimutans]QEC42907.1 RNA polymerase sigma-70 factor [Pseudobacter ginsenosidimutans]RZS74260.1 RNA polymerase sigma-70 factor (ECF subfamily) [Pseudobacter ginsenosidimutans]